MKKSFLLILIFAFSSNPVFSQFPIWVQQTSPVTTDLNGAWACNDQVCWMCGPSGVVIRTTNGGIVWSLANAGLTGNDFYTIAAIDADICCVGGGDGSLWRTVNGGANWIKVTLNPPGVFMNIVHFFNQNLGFAQSDPIGGSWKYWITTNSGANWTAGPVTIPAIGTEAGWNNDYCALDTSFIIWGTNVNKTWKGSFRGTWTSAPTTGLNFLTFNNYLNGIAVNSSGNVYRTTNGGSNWNPAGFTVNGVSNAIKGVPNTGLMFIGTSTNIFRSSNYGANWISNFTLPVSSAVYSLTFSDFYHGWSGTQAGKIFRYIHTVGIDPNNLNIAESYSLQKNYPNPFNPLTTIKYSLPKSSSVSLNIFDALGKAIKKVINQKQEAGNYIEEVDMSSFSSGIYFYTLNTGGFSDTKKMILIK